MKFLVFLYKKLNHILILFFKKTGKHYSVESHIKVLEKIGHIKNKAEKKIIEAKYKKLLKNPKILFFDQAIEILNYLKDKGHRLFLMTLGEPSSQKRKVESSGIKKYFEKVIYETKSKADNKIIKNFVNSGEEVLIINDKASESLAIQKAIGKKAKIFLVNGPHSKNVDHKEKIYKNISELKSIL